MATSDDRLPVARQLVEFFQAPEETREVPTFVTVSLGAIATTLVAASTFTAIETGNTAIGLSFLTAVVLFLGTVSVLEASRLLGE